MVLRIYTFSSKVKLISLPTMKLKHKLRDTRLLESLGVQVKVEALEFISPRLCPSTDERIWKMRT